MDKPKKRKPLVEEGIKLSIFEFRKACALKHGFSFTYTWKNQSRADFIVSMNGKFNYIEFNYVSIPDLTFRFTVNLTKSPCYLGNYRWWFKCPNKKKGKVCNRKVGMLYLQKIGAVS